MPRIKSFEGAPVHSSRLFTAPIHNPGGPIEALSNEVGVANRPTLDSLQLTSIPQSKAAATREFRRRVEIKNCGPASACRTYQPWARPAIRARSPRKLQAKLHRRPFHILGHALAAQN